MFFTRSDAHPHHAWQQALRCACQALPQASSAAMWPGSVAHAPQLAARPVVYFAFCVKFRGGNTEANAKKDTHKDLWSIIHFL